MGSNFKDHFEMSFVSLLLAFGSLALASAASLPSQPRATPDPWWIPVDPRSFPPTLASDRVQVVYAMAPLLEAEIGPVFKLFHVYHGGLIFINTRNNHTFTTNYDSVDLSLFSSQLPEIVKGKNGTTELLWHSAGAVYCYNGIHPKYWEQYPIGEVNGSVFNSFMQNYLIPMNQTWPFYEMFNVKHRDAKTNFLNSRECFDFVVGGIASLNKYGGNLHGTLKRNIVTLFSEKAPQLVNMSDPQVHDKVVSFYELLDGKWGHLKNIFQLIKLLVEVADGSLFYLHKGLDYYGFELQWPILKLSYETVSF